jgi:hypothetical protein
LKLFQCQVIQSLFVWWSIPSLPPYDLIARLRPLEIALHMGGFQVWHQIVLG